MNETLFNDFVQAQNTIYPTVIKELTKGQKRTHWMWFIFPQVKGLGHSTMARRFTIESLEQAKEYLQHEVLGVRLIECAELLLLHPDKRRPSRILCNYHLYQMLSAILNRPGIVRA